MQEAIKAAAQHNGSSRWILILVLLLLPTGIGVRGYTTEKSVERAMAAQTERIARLEEKAAACSGEVAKLREWRTSASDPAARQGEAIKELERRIQRLETR